jgi:hypothetical protein
VIGGVLLWLSFAIAMLVLMAMGLDSVGRT